VNRSYLFAPGHNEKLLGQVFDAGADAVILDLEDAVSPEHKAAARHNVAKALWRHSAWVRINAAKLRSQKRICTRSPRSRTAFGFRKSSRCRPFAG
jgi:citrate lyase beta subunit